MIAYSHPNWLYFSYKNLLKWNIFWFKKIIWTKKTFFEMANVIKSPLKWGRSEAHVITSEKLLPTILSDFMVSQVIKVLLFLIKSFSGNKKRWNGKFLWRTIYILLLFSTKWSAVFGATSLFSSLLWPFKDFFDEIGKLMGWKKFLDDGFVHITLLSMNFKLCERNWN